METPPPPPNPFLNKPFQNSNPMKNIDRSELTNFLEAYNKDPSLYDNQTPIDLIHPEWIGIFPMSLKFASYIGSIQLYKFIIDTGAVIQVPTEQFLRDCFFQKKFSISFTQYLFNLCPNYINLIPANILIYLIVYHYPNLPRDDLQFFWDLCPQLNNPHFLNSKMRFPSPGMINHLLDRTATCIDNGGYDGPLTTRQLEIEYGFSFQDDDIFLFDFLLLQTELSTTLRFLIENTTVRLGPIYSMINPVSDTQDGLRLLPDLFGPIQRIICQHHQLRYEDTYRPPSAEDILWYFKWWKNDILGDVISLKEFKTFIFNVFHRSDFPSWTISLLLIEYLGDNFFKTLSSDKIFNFIDSILKNTDPDIFFCKNKPDNIFPSINALLSFPSVINIIKDHCIYFIRGFLTRSFRWDCAELFLNLGGLTMEQIWSNHSYDSDSDDDDDDDDGDDEDDGDGDEDNDDAGDDEVFTLKTIMPQPYLEDDGDDDLFAVKDMISQPFLDNDIFFLPTDFVIWLSYQQGTQDQLIKMIKSKYLFKSYEWIDEPRPLRQLCLFVDFAYRQLDPELQRPELLQLLKQRSLSQLNPSQPLSSSLSQLNPSQSLSKPQSLSWLQSLIVYAPIDYINVKFTLKLWRDDGDIPFYSTFVGQKSPISLAHAPILIDELDEHPNSPEILLEEIIKGVIAALFINSQENIS